MYALKQYICTYQYQSDTTIRVYFTYHWTILKFKFISPMKLCDITYIFHKRCIILQFWIRCCVTFECYGLFIIFLNILSSMGRKSRGISPLKREKIHGPSRGVCKKRVGERVSNPPDDKKTETLNNWKCRRFCSKSLMFVVDEARREDMTQLDNTCRRLQETS